MIGTNRGIYKPAVDVLEFYRYKKFLYEIKTFLFEPKKLLYELEKLRPLQIPPIPYG
jgi:hypothetical protein